MSQRGVYFALGLEDARKVAATTSDAELRTIVQDEIEERGDEAWLFQVDKGWAGIHRCLTDGQLACDNGEYPLRACVLGGKQLHNEDDFVVSFLTSQQVADVASALASVDREWLRERYRAIDPATYGAPATDEEFDYIWTCFSGLPAFFGRAVAAHRAVIFTVDL